MDTAGLTLKQPDKLNWDKYDTGSKWQAPPSPLGPDGKHTTFFVKIQDAFPETAFTVNKNGYRQYILDPLVITRSPQGDGYVINRTYISVQKFTKGLNPDGTPKQIDASQVGNFLRAASSLGKPQTNAEYDAAIRATAGRIVPCTVDWRAYNKDTGEAINGYHAFPDDPERPGQKKAILKAGDTYLVLDRKGVVLERKTVQAEVLFANLQVQYFLDPAKLKR